VQRGVVRFFNVIAINGNSLPPANQCLPLAFFILVFFCLTSPLFAQKSSPLAARAQTISEYENMIRSGLPLTREDSILVAFAQMKGYLNTVARIASPYGKCGTELASKAHEIQNISMGLKQSFTLPAQLLSDSIKSPSGKFTIYFDKTGENAATSEYVDSVAHYADEAFELEINELGYAKPPFSYGDSTWHISLSHQGVGIYGYTAEIGNPFGTTPSHLSLLRSEITIDNNFDSGYTTLGLDAARITIFHEFHHVIQNGSYGTNHADAAFREMMSVWMETRSTPWVTDYLQYIPSYTFHFDESFDGIDNTGYYGQVIWMQFLANKFGDDVLRHTWEFYSTSKKFVDYLLCFDSILQRLNTNFCTEYMRFGTAVYYTGRNFQGTSIFPDARKFNADYIQKIILQPNTTASILQAFDASLHLFICGYGKDTSVIAVSRSTDRAFNSDFSITSKSVLTFQDSFQFPLTFCDTISLPKLVSTKLFPQPYFLSSASDQPLLNILASTNSYSPLATDLVIYSVNNDLIRHISRTGASEAADPFGGSWYVEWDGRDDSGRLVPSGVYSYSLKIDQVRDNGKFVVIRKN
jgi:hypothetical protein